MDEENIEIKDIPEKKDEADFIGKKESPLAKEVKEESLADEITAAEEPDKTEKVIEKPISEENQIENDNFKRFVTISLIVITILLILLFILK